MVTKRGPILKRLRYYLGQMPPENLRPHKKLNAATRAVLERGRGLQTGLSEVLEEVQARLLRGHLLQKARRGEL